MEAGRLDRRITIQRASVTQSPSGEEVETWAAIGTLRRSASMAPVRGDERLGSPQTVAQEQLEFRVRWSADIAGLAPEDRIIHPALLAVDEVPAVRQIHDVLAVHEIGRRAGLRIITARRADVAS